MPNDVIADKEEISIERFLTTLLGNTTWLKYSSLKTMPREKLFQRAQCLTKLFGEKWKKYPNLLSSETSTIEILTKKHSRVFGSDDWMYHPTLAPVTSRTFDSSFRALGLLGMSYEKQGKNFLMMMSTTMQNKRRKAKIIREELLGHTNVYICDKEVVLLSECVKRRVNLTWEEKENERIEIKEFIRFLEEFPSLLCRSETTIREWGIRKSYHSDCGKIISNNKELSECEDEEENIDTMRFAN